MSINFFSSDDNDDWTEDEDFGEEEVYFVVIDLKKKIDLLRVIKLMGNTLTHFFTRYLSDKEDYYILREMNRIELVQFLYDSFIHCKKLARYKTLDYIAQFDLNQIFDFLLLFVIDTLNDYEADFQDELKKQNKKADISDNEILHRTFIFNHKKIDLISFLPPKCKKSNKKSTGKNKKDNNTEDKK